MGIARANNKNEKGQNNSLFTTSVLRTTQHERERPTATSNPSSSSTYLRRPMLLHSSISPFAFSFTLLLQIFLLFSGNFSSHSQSEFWNEVEWKLKFLLILISYCIVFWASLFFCCFLSIIILLLFSDFVFVLMSSASLNFTNSSTQLVRFNLFLAMVTTFDVLHFSDLPFKSHKTYKSDGK
jgi:hypothetical protein